MDERAKIMRLKSMMQKLDTNDKDTIFNFVESYCEIRHSGTQKSLEEIKTMIASMDTRIKIEFDNAKKSIESIKKELGMNGYGNHD